VLVTKDEPLEEDGDTVRADADMEGPVAEARWAAPTWFVTAFGIVLSTVLVYVNGRVWLEDAEPDIGATLLIVGALAVVFSATYGVLRTRPAGRFALAGLLVDVVAAIVFVGVAL
jgi:hypothetical protein